MMEGLSREQALVCYGIFMAIGYCILLGIWRHRKTVVKLVVAVACVFVFYFGSQVISLNHLTSEVQKKLELVREQVGDTYIRVDGSKIYVNVGDKWLNLNEIAIVGEFTKDIKIDYEGEEIYLGHSGVYNTLKVLNDLGLLGGDK